MINEEDIAWQEYDACMWELSERGDIHRNRIWHLVMFDDLRYDFEDDLKRFGAALTGESITCNFCNAPHDVEHRVCQSGGGNPMAEV